MSFNVWGNFVIRVLFGVALAAMALRKLFGCLAVWVLPNGRPVEGLGCQSGGSSFEVRTTKGIVLALTGQISVC